MLAAEAAGAFAGVAPNASELDTAMLRKIPARKREQEENERREREKRLTELLMHSLADSRGSVFKVSTSGSKLKTRARHSMPGSRTINENRKKSQVGAGVARKCTA
jgi:hypothetical protein